MQVTRLNLKNRSEVALVFHDLLLTVIYNDGCSIIHNNSNLIFLELMEASSTTASREDRVRKRTASVEPAALSSPTRKRELMIIEGHGVRGHDGFERREIHVTMLWDILSSSV